MYTLSPLGIKYILTQRHTYGSTITMLGGWYSPVPEGFIGEIRSAFLSVVESQEIHLGGTAFRCHLLREGARALQVAIRFNTRLGAWYRWRWTRHGAGASPSISCPCTPQSADHMAVHGFTHIFAFSAIGTRRSYSRPGCIPPL